MQEVTRSYKSKLGGEEPILGQAAELRAFCPPPEIINPSRRKCKNFLRENNRKMKAKMAIIRFCKLARRIIFQSSESKSNKH
jgi:hypothetical protein